MTKAATPWREVGYKLPPAFRVAIGPIFISPHRISLLPPRQSP
ncbi:uncharacterized protein CTRU02_215608 [Colletotrichum truncatum]|uniref:Uncharacterized protein n=1 Tax=Colletotrichum truncatum TaxID=5467 RepID=A0ACC3YCC5_COLTU|nr:uncharacterized protein CTRU02_05451 [Colletotrichum truncatum]KAF6793894.1 hypothetical protein CTRU02_05451 [Colletotrichum truncatum]